jgi:hypothetical protein
MIVTPEPKLKKDLLLIAIPSAPLAQNPLLYEATPFNFFYQFCWYKKIERRKNIA